MRATDLAQKVHMGAHQRPGFDDLYAEFQGKIRRYLERLLGPDEAEDATQEVFTRVGQALSRFRGDSSPATWIYRIATNVAYDRLRGSSSRKAGEVPLEDAPPVKDKAAGAEQQLVRREMNDCVDRFIDRLPANYRSVVILSEQEGLTNQEIAETLRVTVDTVKIRLHRARTRLRKELGDGCDFYRDERNELACDPKPNAVFLRGRPPSKDPVSR